MKFNNLYESIVRKKVVREGKRKILKKSNLQGFKMSGGREIKMSPQEVYTRKRSAKKAARKRRTKMATIMRKRKKSNLLKW